MIWSILRFFGRLFIKCLACFFYPCKERCHLCLDKMDKRLNPYKDAGYTDI